MPRPNAVRLVRAAAPGLLVTLSIALGAWLVVSLVALLPPPLGSVPLSMMLVAIITGMALSNLAARRTDWKPGLRLARRQLLKIAVALVGLRLSLVELAELGWQALPLVVLAIAAGLLITLGLARLLGVNQRLAVLLAAGTSICGASAIAATAPGIRASSNETAYAIVCVLLIGLGATIAYPLILPYWFEDPATVGLIMGAAIHDTTQVVAAAVLYEQIQPGEGTLVAATVTKLMRNTALLVVVPMLIWWSMRQQARQSIRTPLPLFIVGFIALSAVRTGGDWLLGAEHPAWQMLIESTGALSLFVFAMAMASLAMAAHPGKLLQTGARPAVLALIAALCLLALTITWMLFMPAFRLN